MCYYSQMIGLDDSLREIVGQQKVVATGDQIISKKLAEVVGFVYTDNQNCLACITPGATIRLGGLPPYMQKRWSCGSSVTLTFVQKESYTADRDRFILPSGTEVSLNALPPGLRGEIVFATEGEKNTIMALQALTEVAEIAHRHDLAPSLTRQLVTAGIILLACSLIL